MKITHFMFLTLFISLNSFAACPSFVARIMTINERDFIDDLDKLDGKGGVEQASQNIIDTLPRVKEKDILSDAKMSIFSDNNGNVWLENFDYLKDQSRGEYYERYDLFVNGIANKSLYSSDILGRPVVEGKVVEGGSVKSFSYSTRVIKSFKVGSAELTEPLLIDFKRNADGCYTFKSRDTEGKPIDFKFTLFFIHKATLLLGSGATKYVLFDSNDEKTLLKL